MTNQYKENIEKSLIGCRDALERGRAAVIKNTKDDETREKLLGYIQGFDDNFMELERQLSEVYEYVLKKNELISIYDEKLHEAYRQIAELKVENKGLEISLGCDNINSGQQEG